MFQLKSNRSSYHIDGIAARTQSSGQDTGTGAVPYFAESTCGALTRGRFQIDLESDDLAKVLADAQLKARVYGRKMCKNCEAAAEAVIAQQS